MACPIKTGRDLVKHTEYLQSAHVPYRPMYVNMLSNSLMGGAGTQSLCS